MQDTDIGSNLNHSKREVTEESVTDNASQNVDTVITTDSYIVFPHVIAKGKVSVRGGPL